MRKFQVHHIVERETGEPGMLLPWQATVGAAAMIARNEPHCHYSYRHVATVEVRDDEEQWRMLESVFDMTNSVDMPWYRTTEWSNGGRVEVVLGVEYARSTSVGDMLVDEITGQRYLVYRVGFEPFDI